MRNQQEAMISSPGYRGTQAYRRIMRALIQFDKKSLLFSHPRSVIVCSRLHEVSDCFCRMEAAVAGGYWLSGFLSYEAGYSFERYPSGCENTDFPFPLVYMGVFERPNGHVHVCRPKRNSGALRGFSLNIDLGRYSRNIAKIREYIAAGDVYQITYCIKLLFSVAGSPQDIYASLLAEHPVPYPAYMETDDFSILSLSPEMFFRKTGNHIVTKPMKGTWPRGNHWFEDMRQRGIFSKDRKNRAENVMIADLLRNDLGRVGANIRVQRLFEITPYRSLFQMTSTVTADVDAHIGLHDLFAAIFPSGSVTGAPKIRAMGIIRELEGEPRHIYTGAIGYITPDRDMFFNVPIRTLLLRNGCGEMGIGGGIVWDSTAHGEWDEGMLKAKFVTCR